MARLNMHLYITADAIGTATGGGRVTHHESRALAALGPTMVWQFPTAPPPWGADQVAHAQLQTLPDLKPQHAHFYSGTFTQTIALLRERGTRITYTAAAHDVEVSRRAHAQFGMPFDYPHLTNADQWDVYVRGYREADAVICPSVYSARIMKSYGCQRVMVIPHGYDPPAQIKAIPTRFVVGYLGQPGPDKGLTYLLRAWDTWSRTHPDALLVIAGRGTLDLLPWIRALCTHGSYSVRGEVVTPSDLYDACCVYVQPSVSEGFGCEVLEARAHGRPVICSYGAGAATFANQVVDSHSADAIVQAIDIWYEHWRASPQSLIERANPNEIEHLTWDKVRETYVAAKFGLA